jgi:hypothetical protein
MSLTAFPRFLELDPELRNRIWEFAITSYIQDVADRLPPSFNRPWAERRRQAIVGYSLGKDRLALSVRIRDPFNGLKLDFEKDEFESLVDCFPISSVCYETRINVAKFCRLLVPHVRFNYDTHTLLCAMPRVEYDTSTLWSLEPPPPSSSHWLPGFGNFKRVFTRPTTLTVNADQFRSAEHLVGTVLWLFGNRIQRLVINLYQESVKRAYWSDPGVAPISM